MNKLIYEPSAENIARLADILRSSRNTIAFTGAGISTESGIPDFRSPGEGVWTQMDPEMLHTRVMQRHPEAFYRHFALFAQLGAGKQPNAGHRAIVALEKAGMVRKVVTQNIDGLHTVAGSRNVLEVHGHFRSCRCLACGREHPYRTLESFLERGEFRPVSPCCNALLRPAVVLFGDNLPESFYAFMQRDIRAFDFVLVLGTSLQVYPAAYVPETVGRFAIINREPTGQDDRAKMVIHAPIGETLVRLLDHLGLTAGEAQS